MGGGQLARMTALAALPPGCDAVFLERDSNCPAAWLAPRLILGEWNDPETLMKFAEQVDVITLENEFVSAIHLAWLEESGYRVFPTAASIASVQDKLVQKQKLVAAGLPVADFREVNVMDEVADAAKILGWPLVPKSRRNGYDGRGNFTLNSSDDVPRGWKKLGGAGGRLVEAFWPSARNSPSSSRAGAKAKWFPTRWPSQSNAITFATKCGRRPTFPPRSRLAPRTSRAARCRPLVVSAASA